MLQTIPDFPVLSDISEQSSVSLICRSLRVMSLTDTQVLVALVVALIPGVLAFRLATALYK
jgi:photosystem I subunit XII